MELLCIQSQEHPELPLAELRAVMECEDIDAEIDDVAEESKEKFNLYATNIENLHKYNLHKYLGKSPAIHLDLWDSSVKGG